MKSNKQRRAEIMAARHARAAGQHHRASACESPRKMPPRAIAVTLAALADYASYGQPDFVVRGYYEDKPFRCHDCGAEEVWPAERQKWWYEVAKGYVYSTAVRCKACRARERARKDAARQAAGHLGAAAR